tara:strand:- start:416 stop:1165 length:750 start_codon:yes stop_codon:yes gene_type:complete
MKKFKIDKMLDKSDNYTTEKDDNLFNLPMRLLMIAKTGDSKSTTLGNLLLKKEGYRTDFTPDKIFVFSASVKGDEKLKIMIEELDIPEENIFNDYDDEVLSVIYDMLVEDYCENIDEGITKPKLLNSLIIFDDLAFNDSMKAQAKESMIKKLFMNGRKYLLSCIVISQKYSSLGTTLRENASGLIIGKASNKQVDLIEADHNYLKGGKKIFKDMFRDTTETPFSKLIINFSKPNLYYNQNFDAIDIAEY